MEPFWIKRLTIFLPFDFFSVLSRVTSNSCTAAQNLILTHKSDFSCTKPLMRTFLDVLSLRICSKERTYSETSGLNVLNFSFDPKRGRNLLGRDFVDRERFGFGLWNSSEEVRSSWACLFSSKSLTSFLSLSSKGFDISKDILFCFESNDSLLSICSDLVPWNLTLFNPVSEFEEDGGGKAKGSSAGIRWDCIF